MGEVSEWSHRHGSPSGSCRSSAVQQMPSFFYLSLRTCSFLLVCFWVVFHAETNTRVLTLIKPIFMSKDFNMTSPAEKLKRLVRGKLNLHPWRRMSNVSWMDGLLNEEMLLETQICRSLKQTCSIRSKSKRCRFMEKIIIVSDQPPFISLFICSKGMFHQFPPLKTDVLQKQTPTFSWVFAKMRYPQILLSKKFRRDPNTKSGRQNVLSLFIYFVMSDDVFSIRNEKTSQKKPSGTKPHVSKGIMGLLLGVLPCWWCSADPQVNL